MTKFSGGYPILRKEEISSSVFKIAFKAEDIAREAQPGQFIQLRTSLDYFPFWPRPFSIHDAAVATGEISIIFKVFGCGTAKMSAMRPGEIVQLLGPLGNTFPELPKRTKVILAAGGIGLPPLHFLAKKSILNGFPSKNMIFIAGARSQADFFKEDGLHSLGLDLTTCTDDGSVGRQGTVVDLLSHRLRDCPDATVYACGPTPMLEATDRLLGERGQNGYLSLEALMPCGYGVCSGCAIKVVLSQNRGLTDDGRDYHLKRVCVDGPVFKTGEVIWS